MLFWLLLFIYFPFTRVVGIFYFLLIIFSLILFSHQLLAKKLREKVHPFTHPSLYSIFIRLFLYMVNPGSLLLVLFKRQRCSAPTIWLLRSHKVSCSPQPCSSPPLFFTLHSRGKRLPRHSKFPKIQILSTLTKKFFALAYTQVNFAPLPLFFSNIFPLSSLKHATLLKTWIFFCYLL